MKDMFVKEKITKKTIGVLIFVLTAVIFVACSSDDPVPVPDPVNRAPLAMAGDDREAEIGSTVMLDASASTDPDGDALTFTWSLLSVPDGSTATISGAGNLQADFVLDKAGDYQVRLQVGDGSSETTDNFTVSNKTPVITDVKTSSIDFPDLENDIAERGTKMEINGTFYSPNVEENKVFLGDVECEILELITGEGVTFLEVLIPDEAVTGNLRVTVGEKSNTWSKPIRLFEIPLAAFIENDPLLGQKKRSNTSGTYFEVGVTFKPLVNGQIAALGHRSPTVGSARFTVWDVESGEPLNSFSAQTTTDRTWSMLDIPVTVEAGKVYRITMFFNDWFIQERDPQENIFPKTQGNIEIRNSISSPAELPSDYDEFKIPDFIVDNYLYDSVDFVFVPDAL